MGNLNEGCTVVSFEMLTATDRAVPGCRHCFFCFYYHERLDWVIVCIWKYVGIRTNAPKKGNYATVSHTEFELNSVGNDWVRVDYGPGARKIGSKIACHFKTNNKIIEIERQLCTLYPAQACKHSNTMPAQQHRTSYIWWLYVSHIMYHLYRMQKGGGGDGGQSILSNPT